MGSPDRADEVSTPVAAIDEMLRSRQPSIWRRLALTYRYLGPRELTYRILTFPLRFTPLRKRLKLGAGIESEQSRAAAWYREHGRRVAIVIPTYGSPDDLENAIASIRKTTQRDRVDIIVADDASAPEHVERLKRLQDVRLVLGDKNVGFAANANRGIAASDPRDDVVLLNSDVVALPDWLACLQFVASAADDVGIVGAKLLYPDGRIQHAGVHRNLGAPVWFDHRFRFKSSPYGPANVALPVLAVTGACMYAKREVLDQIGRFDERYSMAYEDVDWCLRAWERGYRVLYYPAATLYHLESVTRGMEVGEREQASQDAFWERWKSFFDERHARTSKGALRVIYVTEDTGVGGGHRDIFEHLNRLKDRGHDVRLFSLGGQPDWFPLRTPLVTFEDYEDLAFALAEEDAIKVATWWNTAPPVWRASVLRGIPVFFVQDIETSLLPRGRGACAITSSRRYRHEFRFMTISGWNADRLRELGLDADAHPARHRPRHVPAARRDRAPRRHAARPWAQQPAKEPAAHGRRLARASRAATGAVGCSASSRSSPLSTGIVRRDRAERRARQRALQRGDAVRPDLDARGLLPAAAGGDGDRRGRRLHRRPRQPRLLPRRRELPDAGGRPSRRSAAPSRGCWTIPSCASASARRVVARRRTTRGSTGSTSSRPF